MASLVTDDNHTTMTTTTRRTTTTTEASQGPRFEIYLVYYKYVLVLLQNQVS